jgi:hypothetical protein
MSFDKAFLLVPNPVVSGMIWFVILSVFFYMARLPAQRMILALAGAVYRGFRVAAKSILRAERSFSLRNREVLFAHGREQKERELAREFERIDAAVRRELGEVPALSRRVNEEITRAREDHEASGEVPPSPPGWIDAVKAVAKIDARGEPVVGKVLESIHSSLVKAQATATEEYRKSTQARHKHLNAMMPRVRKLDQTLNKVDANVNTLLDKSKLIDRHMDHYEGILRQTDSAMRALATSAFTYFAIAALVLTIAVFGAGINFRLIARPMAEMVGGNVVVGGLRISEIGALVIILLEVFMGVFLMEALRITNLFPVIGALKDSTRVKLAWACLFLLTMFACIEAGLALMREILVRDEAATNAFLRGESAAAIAAGRDTFRWMTTAAQMGLGFFLPFVLAVVAIPLETFMHTGRVVFGSGVAAGMRALAALLRILGTVTKAIGTMAVHLYDVMAAPLLTLEWLVQRRRSSEPRGPAWKARKDLDSHFDTEAA